MRELYTISEIMDLEGFSNWEVCVTPSSNYCWVDAHRIEVSEKQASSLAMWLHELAHAIQHRDGGRASQQYEVPHGNKHDGHWADVYTELVRRYMCPKAVGGGDRGD